MSIGTDIGNTALKTILGVMAVVACFASPRMAPLLAILLAVYFHVRRRKFNPDIKSGKLASALRFCLIAVAITVILFLLSVALGILIRIAIASAASQY